jgi:amidohydrolase
MIEEIKKRAAEIEARVVKFRREIHSHPELSGSEEKTARFIAAVLEDNDIEIETGVGGNGIVALIKGGHAGEQRETIAIRADMDALPIGERGDCVYASKVDGVMHACGHDAHSAILMGTAIVLGGLRDKLTGDVKLIFQPSEEVIPGGALAMIDDGVLDNPRPSAMVALHCTPELEAGFIGHKEGTATASCDFITISIIGTGGHSSRPHQTVDAILVAALVVNAIHHIVSRRTDPLHHVAISLGTIKGGNAPNIIADNVEITGTVRVLSPELRAVMPGLLEQTIKGITMSVGGSYSFKYNYGHPSVVNDGELNDIVTAAAKDLFGEEKALEMKDPQMGAEDFAYFAEKVPSILYRLGTGNKAKGIVAPLHNSCFDIDESALTVGVQMMSLIACEFFERRRNQS